ncbi:MAG: alpha/beta hydrolase, partial [Clostridia bacterium]|nr:alpha/beta hydrolase [Clostridia bacterium]
MERIDYTMKDGKLVSVCVWKPAGEVKGVVQLSHGMAEHVLRYDHIATFLCERGYLVIGDDHRAHG